jgi:hypothetical protein
MFSLLREKKPNFDENKSQSVVYNLVVPVECLEY